MGTTEIFLLGVDYILQKLWEWFLFSLPPLLFVTFANIGSILGRRSVRFSLTDSGYYVAVDGPLSRQFRNRKQNYPSYKLGLAHRGSALGAAYLLDEITFRSSDFVVDVGANVGDLQLYFKSRDLNIDYLGIEPAREEFVCLRNNVAPGGAMNFALWNEDKTMDFFVSSDHADSSLIRPKRFTELVSIPARRLDGVLGGGSIRLLKVEAEGAEPEVLIGCGNLLEKCDYISADLGFERGVAEESTFAEVTNFLLGRGFRLVSVGRSRMVGLYKNLRVG